MRNPLLSLFASRVREHAETSREQLARLQQRIASDDPSRRGGRSDDWGKLREVDHSDSQRMRAVNEREHEAVVATVGELTGMLDGMLQMLNKILDGCEDGRTLNAAQIGELRDHAQLWSRQIARLKKVVQG